MDETARLIAIIVVASFAIERVATAAFFLLSFIPSWNLALPDASHGSADGSNRNARLAYFTLVGVLALGVVLSIDSLRVLHALGFQPHIPFLDVALTTMVLMGGADQIAALLKSPQSVAAARSPPKPIEITGTIRLDDRKPGGD
jgi:hypothetical protein